MSEDTSVKANSESDVQQTQDTITDKTNESEMCQDSKPNKSCDKADVDTEVVNTDKQDSTVSNTDRSKLALDTSELDTEIPADMECITPEDTGYTFETSTAETCTSGHNDLDAMIPTNPGFQDDNCSVFTEDYYEEVNVKKDSETETETAMKDTTAIRTSTPVKSNSSLSNLIGNANLMGSTSTLIRSTTTPDVKLRKKDRQEEDSLDSKTKLMNSRAVSSSQPALSTISRLKKIR